VPHALAGSPRLLLGVALRRGDRELVDVRERGLAHVQQPHPVAPEPFAEFGKRAPK
jgi:hypothetical protein